MSHLPTVLIVEDDIHISKLIAVLLEEAGYQAIRAGSAADALDRVEHDRLDLVVLDWMLPDMPGDQVCRVIKQRSDGIFLPVLMLTARAELADRVAGLEAGADDYLTKPFHGDELLARARALLRIRAAEQARAETIAELERRHAELTAAYDQLRSTQAQLVQTSKLAALGELVAGVAHELNNPLAIILGNAELLPTMPDEDDRRAVRQIIDAAQRGRRVIQSLVTFARHGQVDADWHNPRDLVERVLDLKRGAFQTGEITLEVRYQPDLPMLWGDGPQLQQVLLGLLNNAEQALVGRERPCIVIQVSAGGRPIGPPALLPEVAPPPGAANGAKLVVFEIADDGPGIAPAVLERLFEPYVTTRPLGQGSGMSLAIAYAIVQQHGGTLEVATEASRGTTFRMALPVGRPEPRQPAPVPASRPASGRVLVIDDEPAIVDLVTRLLSRNGYLVAGMRQARAALEELRRNRWDTVLCDIRMPDMDGVSFHRQLEAAQLEPAPRLVIMTGDTNNARTEDFLSRHKLPVLRKPFTRQELLDVLSTSEQ
jgi:two-component system NtrC family sensor kinase